jgi:pimeloyl-[acyl-carrier protein] methyl ester esterase
MMAMQAALDAPVAGLVLISTTPRFCVTPDWPHGLRPVDVRLLRRGIETDPAAALQGFYRQCAAPHDPLSARAGAADRSFLAEGLRLLMTWDLRVSMLSLDVPTLVLHGEEDRVIPAPAGRALCRTPAASEWRGFRGIGHDLPRRCPAAVAKTITDWIRHGH